VTTLGEVLASLESHLFVGRQRELEYFSAWLCLDRPTIEILNVTGPGGVGKSALLSAFACIAAAQGRPVIRVDAGDFRPTAEGFLQALGTVDLAQAHARLNAQPSVVLMAQIVATEDGLCGDGGELTDA
jgi:hypothetical protein